MTKLETTYSTIEWSADGLAVSKTRLPTHDARSRFRNELSVNRLLRCDPPAIPTPRLRSYDRRHLRLEFDRVDGEPLGPKYPRALDSADLTAIVELMSRLRTYNPRRRWLRRFNAQRRLESARVTGYLTDVEAERLSDIAARLNPRLRFSHGDVTARNVLRSADELVLIDWEWSGLYPANYDLAFLWYSLVDVPEGRSQVENHCTGDERSFLLSALLIQLRHLQLYISAEFRDKHLATRDDLISRLLVS